MDREQNLKTPDELFLAWQKIAAQSDKNLPLSARKSIPVEATTNLHDDKLAFIAFGSISAIGAEIFLIAGTIGAAMSGDVKAAAVVGSFSALIPAALGISIHSFNTLINSLENRMIQCNRS